MTLSRPLQYHVVLPGSVTCWLAQHTLSWTYAYIHILTRVDAPAGAFMRMPNHLHLRTAHTFMIVYGHVRTYMHTCIHTRTHTHIHAHTHTHMHTYTYTHYTYLHTHTYIYIYIDVCIHT